MQNDEPQRPAPARPSLLAAGPEASETKSILSELDSAGGRASAPRVRTRPGRKGLVAGAVLVLAAMGGTAALVMGDVNSTAQLAGVAKGVEGDAAPDSHAAQVAVVSGGDENAAAYVRQLAAPAAGQPQAAEAAPSTPAEPPLAAAAVAAPAVALASALAAPSQDKPSTAATIVDAEPAAADTKPAAKPVHKAVARERKAVPAKVKERHARIAKAKAPAEKIAKEKPHKKALQPLPASSDNDVELLAALVAHTRPQQAARTAPCAQGDDKASGGCSGGQKR
ncbi:hypothetical protein GCM10027277_10820 [Pseudoduganella ginsengisoli]|uniref:Uncharacterized protein n=1 Tax=Pseudoduganella ginsengisoli TaxID=1462440 RepID=A0A6L6PWX8_9BURK|nr:hypothetical protein [Pseudoduganella ginsengisoli]MTW01478.1 hypothetical protein [Pseudoduganella ginsengisoli]